MTEGMPDWVLYTGTVIGSAVVFVLGKLGLNAGKKRSGETKDVQIAGAIVDNSAIALLAGSVEGMTGSLVEARGQVLTRSEELATALTALSRAMDGLRDEIERHRVEIRQHANEVRSSSR